MHVKLVILFIAGFLALFSPHSARSEIAVGQSAPAFVTQRLDDKAFDLSTLKGKIVVLHFWATWCAPCREEMPALEAVWRHYHSQGLEVLAVSGDRPRAHDEVDQVMHYFSFPASMLSASTKNDFGVPSVIPITYVIGKDGNIAAILTPNVMPLTEASLGDEVKKLLDPKDPSKIDAKSDSKSDAKP